MCVMDIIWTFDFKQPDNKNLDENYQTIYFDRSTIIYGRWL